MKKSDLDFYLIYLKFNSFEKNFKEFKNDLNWI
jgi:hypothetical protein